jgi:hypothetical protein
MPTGTFEYRDDGERRAMERAIAFVAEMRDLAQTAPNGQVLALCEGQAVDRGRDLLRATLEEAVQARVDAAEGKKGRRGNARAGAGSASSGGATGRCGRPSGRSG